MKRPKYLARRSTKMISSKMGLFTAIVLGLLVIGISGVFAQNVPTLPRVSIDVSNTSDPNDLAVQIQILLLLTILALAPSILIMTTSFVRVVIALHFVRQALGTQGVPPNQMMAGLALFLTFFIMNPVFTQIYENAWQPYSAQEISLQLAWERGQEPLRTFMLSHTRDKDLEIFIRMADMDQPANSDELPMKVIIPGFIISEMRVGFQMGFLIYMPFLIIDMVVASVLMSMGMMMLPPVMISLPFKLLMFVLVDGWYLVIQSVVESFK